ncbi:MAG: carboxypeptidase regulatory-like domain-containing protein, partial [Vicinamibacteraceae bacterium]
MSAVVRGLMVTLSLLGIAAASAAQMLTGTITGTVSDSTDSILPGVTVTVTGERLIGGPQSAVTDQQGTYRIDGLPPGDYDVTFELPGFTPVDRRGVRLSAGFVATINAELGVGTLEDRVTVTGESPVVDTRSNVQQTVMGQEILEAIPTGRDAWSLAKIIPGVAVGTYDVGGTQGMQQSDITAHGSRGDDKTFAVDGLSVNWPGNGGGGTMVYYDQGMFEETNYQTSAIPAEVSIGGVYMNMVTKAGGNTWTGDLRYYYADDGMQSENFQEVSERFDFPGGNPVVTQYDFNAGAGGPLMRDRLWFFGSFRRWRVDKEVLAVRNPDGTHPLDDNLIWNGSGKLTARLTPNHRIQGVYNYNQKDRYHRQDADAAFIESAATTLQEQPGYAAQLKYTAVLSGETL